MTTVERAKIIELEKRLDALWKEAIELSAIATVMVQNLAPWNENDD